MHGGVHLSKGILLIQFFTDRLQVEFGNRVQTRTRLVNNR